MEIVEVDVIGSEAGEALLERRANLVTLAEARTATTAEFGGQHHVGAATRDRAANHLFAVARSIDVGGVDERDPEFEGTSDGRGRVRVLGATVDAGEAHRPEAHRRDHRSFCAETAMLHGRSSRFPSTESQASGLIRRDA